MDLMDLRNHLKYERPTPLVRMNDPDVECRVIVNSTSLQG